MKLKQLFFLLTILFAGFFIVGCADDTIDPIDEVTLSDIAITEPTKLTYYIGEELDLTGFVVNKLFSNDSLEAIVLADVQVTGFDNTAEGTQTITITYLIYTKTFQITVQSYGDDIEDLESFNVFLDELFVKYLEGDAFSVNYLLKNPENYGLDDEEARLSRPSLEDFNEMMDETRADIERLKAFNYYQLSKNQKLTYDILLFALEDTLAFEPYFYLSNSYLGSYLGYQAQLPIILAEYRFDDMVDIENYFSLVEDIPAAFESYLLYEKERSLAGFGMADFVIDKVIEQAEKMIAETDSIYLVDNFNHKIEGLDFLTPTQKEELSGRNQTLIETSFMGGYAYLAEHLDELKGLQSNVGGLFHLEGGKEYYQALFSSATGTTILVDDAFDYIKTKISYYYGEYYGLSANPTILREYRALKFTELTPDEMVAFHRTMLAGKFPALSIDPEYLIKRVDPSMEKNFSPAAYFLSPIDAMVTEVMYLNNLYTKDTNYIYTTLAHEGYPGHLYQHVYFKSETDAPMIRHLLNFSGYQEGWASYVENLSVWYGTGTDRAKSLYLANQDFNAALTALIDMGIHYYGWSVVELGQYLNTNYGFNATGYQDLYNQLVEVPTNVQEYYFSYFTILDYKQEVAEALGNDLFSVLEFHKVLLDTGPAPFHIIKAELDRYVEAKLAE